MKVTLAQISSKLSQKKQNISLHKNIILKSNDDVVVFPELSLSGYLLMDRVYDDAYSLDELEVFKELSKEKDIVLGVPLKDDHRVFNSAVCFSEGEIKHIHYKNNLPNYGMFEEARFFFKGSELESFETKFGKVCMVVCEDLWSSKNIDKLCQLKPDIIYAIANSPARGFTDNGLDIEKKWKSILKTTALLSGANIVFVNRVGFEDGLGFWGGSMIVGADGLVKEQLDLFEQKLESFSLERNLSQMQKYMLRNG
jgi:predicted amidohydrolase